MVIKLAVISIRVPATLKKEMEKYDVNWSEVIRQMIQEQIEIERRKKAAEAVDEVRKRIKPGFDSVKAIREDRDA